MHELDMVSSIQETPYPYNVIYGANGGRDGGCKHFTVQNV